MLKLPRLTLSDDALRAMQDMIDAPPEPSERLREAARRHKARPLQTREVAREPDLRPGPLLDEN